MSCVKVAQKLLPLLGQYCDLVFGVAELDGRNITMLWDYMTSIQGFGKLDDIPTILMANKFMALQANFRVF